MFSIFWFLLLSLLVNESDMTNVIKFSNHKNPKQGNLTILRDILELSFTFQSSSPASDF